MVGFLTLYKEIEMIKLFNKDNNGGQELVSVLGMIDSDIDFSKWEPILPLAIRDVKAIVGGEAVDAVAKSYNGAEANPEMVDIIRLVQQSVAFFAWLKIIPTLEAQHGPSGRGKRLGENEKAMTALQEWKDEENIRNMAYEAVDAIIELLESGSFEFWENSTKRKAISRLLISNKEIFDEYYIIGSHRLFLTLAPMIREVQDATIIPIISKKRYDELIIGDDNDNLLDYIRRPLALLTMKKAVERLPIEVLPCGIVQVQQVGTIKEKVKAEKEARNQVSQSLGEDANAYLNTLMDIIKELDTVGDVVDYHIPTPTIQTKGMTF